MVVYALFFQLSRVASTRFQKKKRLRGLRKMYFYFWLASLSVEDYMKGRYQSYSQ